MKHSIKGILLSVMMCISGSMYASHVSVDYARQVADGFLQSGSISQNGPRKAPRKILKSPRTLLSDQQFYVFDIDGGGFVIIAADDCAHPVLAYGEKGLSPENSGNGITMPDNLRNWLEGYNYSIRAAIADGYKAPASVQEEWNALAEGKYTVAEPVVEPLIKTKWSQNQEYINVKNTYNYYTPADVYVYEGQEYPMNTPVGCVATAMAQVMKYWEWPKKGTGSHSYLPMTNPKYGVQSANFGATTYDWANMPDSLTYDKSTNTQIKAIALLMYHCGVACNMNYDMEGSGTSTVIYFKEAGYSPAEHALCTYFGYSNTLESYQRQDFERNEDWIQMLKDELDAARPVMYAGTGKDAGGHSFVCCGYDTQDRFYFNFGWGGSYDGYFAVDAIQPGGSGTGGNTDHDYSYNQDVIIGIRPAQSAEETANDVALRLYYDANNDYSPQLASDSIWYYYDSQKLNCTIANYDSVNYSGALALLVLDDAGRVIVTSQAVDFQLDPLGISNVDLQLAPSLGLVPGHYHIQPVFRNNAGGWTSIEARHYWSKLEYTVYHWANIIAYSEMTIFPEPLVQGRSVTVNQALANVSGAPLTGKVYASLYTLDSEWVQDIDTIDFSGSPLNDYTYINLSYTGSVKAQPGEYALIMVYEDSKSMSLVGSDMYAAAKRVTVLSSSEAPEQETGYAMTIHSFVPQNAENGRRSIYAGDTIGAYVEMANEGLIDYSGSIVLQLVDDNYNVIKEAYYNLSLNSNSLLSASLKVDTVLNPGNYYLLLYYYDTETKEYKVFKEGKATYWSYFTVYPASPTAMEDTESAMGVRVYPNPVENVLFVEGAEIGQFNLFNLSGQLLMSRKENAAQQLSLIGLSAGEYILQLVDTKGNVSVHRVTKR